MTEPPMTESRQTRPRSLLSQIDDAGARLSRAEAELHELTTALSRAFDGTAKMDAEGRYVYVNDLYAASFGYTTEDLCGLPGSTTVVDGDLAAMRAAIAECAGTGSARVEVRGLRKDGSVFWKRVALVRVPPELDQPYRGYYAFVRDITDSKRWATELQLSERRFATLVRAHSDIVYVRDVHGFFSDEQPSWAAFTGQTYAEYQGLGWVEAIHPDDRFRSSERWAHAVSSGTLYECQYRLRRHDGAYRDVFARAAPVLGDDSTIHEWIGACEDITEQRRTARALQIQERTLTAAPNGILITDSSLPDEPIIYCNPAFERLSGYTQAEVLGSNCRFLQGPGTDPTAVRKLRTAIRARQSCRVHILNYRKDGAAFWNDLAISPILDEQGECTNYIGVQYPMEGVPPTEIPPVPQDAPREAAPAPRGAVRESTTTHESP